MKSIINFHNKKGIFFLKLEFLNKHIIKIFSFGFTKLCSMMTSFYQKCEKTIINFIECFGINIISKGRIIYTHNIGFKFFCFLVNNDNMI